MWSISPWLVEKMVSTNNPLRFQFSLRWLLIVVTVFALLMGISAVLGDGVRFIIGIVVYVILPTPFVITAIYARGDVRAFAIGALVPWAAMWVDGVPRSTPLSEVIWFLFVGGLCGAIAVLTRRWIVREGWDKAD